MVTLVDWIAIALSAVALLVSSRAAHSASGASNKANDLQARLVGLEEGREAERRQAAQRAHVIADIVGGNGSSRVYLRNVGYATARDVQLFLDDVNLRECRFRIGTVRDNVVLASGADVYFMISRAMGTPSHFRARTTWSDDLGPGEWQSDISVV